MNCKLGEKIKQGERRKRKERERKGRKREEKEGKRRIDLWRDNVLCLFRRKGKGKRRKTRVFPLNLTASGEIVYLIIFV